MITFQKGFEKDLRKIPPKAQEKFFDRLIFFKKDQFDPILNNHALRGTYLGYRSINVTGDLRAIYRIDGDSFIFVAIGSHSSLYG